jgi:hypothetical protein
MTQIKNRDSLAFFLKTELVEYITLRIATILLCFTPALGSGRVFDRNQRTVTLAYKIARPPEGCRTQPSKAHRGRGTEKFVSPIT